MLEYPPGEKGSITVHENDLLRLAEGEFLNDVIVDFYFKYLQHTVLAGGPRACDTFIFNSYFYTRLTSRDRSG